MAAAIPTPHLRRYLPRSLKTWVLWFVALMLVVSAVLYLEFRSTPSWYKPMQGTIVDVQTQSLRAEAEVHNFIDRTKRPGDEVNQLVLTQDQVNSCLAVDFDQRKTQANTTEIAPGNLTAPAMVIFETDSIMIAAKIAGIPGSGSGGTVASVRFSVERVATATASEPALWRLKIHWVHLGNLPVSADWICRQLGASGAATGNWRQALSTLAGNDFAANFDRALRGQPFNPTFNCSHRQVMVQDFQVEKGLLKITLMPPAGPENAPSTGG